MDGWTIVLAIGLVSATFSCAVAAVVMILSGYQWLSTRHIRTEARELGLRRTLRDPVFRGRVEACDVTVAATIGTTFVRVRRDDLPEDVWMVPAGWRGVREVSTGDARFDSTVATFEVNEDLVAVLDERVRAMASRLVERGASIGAGQIVWPARTGGDRTRGAIAEMLELAGAIATRPRGATGLLEIAGSREKNLRWLALALLADAHPMSPRTLEAFSRTFEDEDAAQRTLRRLWTAPADALADPRSPDAEALAFAPTTIAVALVDHIADRGDGPAEQLLCDTLERLAPSKDETLPRGIAGRLREFGGHPALQAIQRTRDREWSTKTRRALADAVAVIQQRLPDAKPGLVSLADDAADAKLSLVPDRSTVSLGGKKDA